MHMDATDPPRPVPAPPLPRPAPPAAHTRPLLLRLYLAGSRRAAGVMRRVLDRRRAEGKEDAGRLGERMGEASLPRPEGQLVWFHAASVGEAASLLEMLRRLVQARPSVRCLVTTGTVTSAQFLADRLPENCLHQFVPMDVLPWVKRFLDHWRPDLAVWTESELWPATLSRDPLPRHPDAPHQRPHLDAELPPLADDAAPRRSAPRPLRPHPRPGRARRRAADRARRRPGAALGRGHPQGGRRPLAL